MEGSGAICGREGRGRGVKEKRMRIAHHFGRKLHWFEVVMRGIKKCLTMIFRHKNTVIPVYRGAVNAKAGLIIICVILIDIN